MSQPQIVRTLASVRVPSSYGPTVDYELLHAVLSWGTVQREAVIIRLVVNNVPHDERPPEILVEDLPGLQQQWQRFVQDVLWRRSQAGDTAAQEALLKMQQAGYVPPPGAPTPLPTPAISASGGRFGQGTGEVPQILVKKEKKKSEGPPEAPIIPGITSAQPGRKYFGKMIEEESSAPSAQPKHPPIDKYQVVGFHLSAPPNADTLMKPIQSLPDTLIVVCAQTLAVTVESFIKDMKRGTVHGRPKNFEPIVIKRAGQMNPAGLKKIRAEVAGGIARMLGDPQSVLWILP